MHNSIQVLSTQLANQIAAGEVVERPASVVKELVENSIDAGADTIWVDIEQGGHKRILVRDNGKGIVKSELGLALSRHATSKITTLADLDAIQSMGFRGEALASISSVSRLALTSKPSSQNEAWQARAEGRDMEVEISPAAHPDGTSIEVLDLFFNTPARRKFLRAAKTEYQHIEETLVRIALSHPQVSFQIKHNAKLVHNWRAVDSTKHSQRVGDICGRQFVDNSVRVEQQVDNIHIYGWCCAIGQGRRTNDLQYSFVNQRMMRDKVILHAIRQAFEGMIAEHTYPAFVLFIDLPATQLDVNVHPAKHEVRFHQARQVHDLIYASINRALLDAPATDQNINRQTVLEAPPRHQYGQQDTQTKSNASYITPLRSQHPSQGASRAYVDLMTSSGQTKDAVPSTPPPQLDMASLVYQDKLVAVLDEQLFALPLSALRAHQLATHLAQAETVQPLLMPVSCSIDKAENARIDELRGFACVIESVQQKWILKQVPAALRKLPWIALFPQLIGDNSNNLSILEHIGVFEIENQLIRPTEMLTYWQALPSAEQTALRKGKDVRNLVAQATNDV